MDSLLVSAAVAAKLLGISRSLFYSMMSAGKIGPLPKRLNRRTLWSRKELELWIEADCPAREQWQDKK